MTYFAAISSVSTKVWAHKMLLTPLFALCIPVQESTAARNSETSRSKSFGDRQIRIRCRNITRGHRVAVCWSRRTFFVAPNSPNFLETHSSQLFNNFASYLPYEIAKLSVNWAFLGSLGLCVAIFRVWSPKPLLKCYFPSSLRCWICLFLSTFDDSFAVRLISLLSSMSPCSFP